MQSPDSSREQLTLSNALPSEEYIPRAMPRILTSLGMTAIYITAIFWLPNITIAATAGPAALTYLLLEAITFFLPCAIATAQLGAIFPYEGSVYNWTHKAFGGNWSFFIGFCFWLPSIFAIISGADALVTYIQALHSGWLVEPWQQGLIIIGLILFSTLIAIQRLRAVQYINNLVIGLMLFSVIIIVISAIVWLSHGHTSATQFTDVNTWQPTQNNIYLFGLILSGYLGITIPLNMAGEAASRSTITRHIFWGTLIIFVGYLISMFSLLVVSGSAITHTPVLSFAWVSMVDTVLGKGFGNIVALSFMSFFFMASVIYNISQSRFLLIGGIDLRLPARMSQLNTNRVPANAIYFQSFIAILFTAIIFIAIPLFFQIGNTVNLPVEVFNISLASLTIIWAFATIFLFVDLARISRIYRQLFLARHIVPMPILWVCIVLGPLSCIVAIIATLLNSWTPLINNYQWWYLVGGTIILCFILAGIGSMLARSEADWQDINSEG